MTLEKFHEGDLFCPYFLHMGKKKLESGLHSMSSKINFPFNYTIQYTQFVMQHFNLRKDFMHCHFFTTLMKCCLFQQKQPLDISWHNSWRGLQHLAATCVLDTTWRPGDCSSKWHLPPTQSGGKAGGESHHGWGARGGVQWSPRLDI